MNDADAYDRMRDERIDFPDNPQAEPDLDEVKERAYYANDYVDTESDKFIGGKR